MRTLISGTLVFLLSLVCSAQTQNQTEAPVAPARQDGGVRAVLESIVIPPIPNQPFTATLQTEWIQYTGEGGTITLVNERPLARDSKGRVYQ